MEHANAAQAFRPAGSDFPSLTFQVEQDVFSITARYVSCIILTPDEVIHVPESPAFCKGLIHLRGQVIPLVDLRTLFGIFPAGGGPHPLSSLVIIVESETGSLGLIVDAVHAVETVSPIDQANAGAGGSHSRFVTGVGKSDKTGKTLLILNGAALLSLCAEMQY